MSAIAAPENRLRHSALRGLSIIEHHPRLSSAETSAAAAQRWIEGSSPLTERLRARATQVGEDGAGLVYIHGEPGVGKLRVARWVHQASGRAGRPLMVVDAADPGVVQQLGAIRDALRENDPTVPGSVAVRNTHRSNAETLHALLELITIQGVQLRCALLLMAREDLTSLRARSLHHGQLVARAEGNVLSVPPLRSRGRDVTELARVFLAEAAERFDRPVRGLSPQAQARLDGHSFPGNVRELASMIEQAVLRTRGDWVGADAFPALGRDDEPQSEGAEIVIRMPGSSLREIELSALKLALKLADGRIVRAAELLGITRHALRRKLEKFNLTDLRRSPGGSASSGTSTPSGDGFI